MGILYIAEYQGLADVASPGGWPSQVRGWTHIAGTPPVAEQKLTYTGGVQVSAAFSATTRMVRLHTDSICSVSFSSGGTNATAANARMAANQTEYFGVSPGSFVSVITNT